ncbi:hypothetical protein QAD02_007682 [Eretmocerus hayati]|uniref:Uncharacterized protein n=1 Tax=Eretmocerus hayati TaxID=131215 RepID=A0ACC2N4B7_9HYME|nr:hypothetical protein QAD02_007682 [Eretmocerus hayati]
MTAIKSKLGLKKDNYLAAIAKILWIQKLSNLEIGQLVDPATQELNPSAGWREWFLVGFQITEYDQCSSFDVGLLIVYGIWIVLQENRADGFCPCGNPSEAHRVLCDVAEWFSCGDTLGVYDFSQCSSLEYGDNN